MDLDRKKIQYRSWRRRLTIKAREVIEDNKTYRIGESNRRCRRHKLETKLSQMEKTLENEKKSHSKEEKEMKRINETFLSVLNISYNLYTVKKII